METLWCPCGRTHQVGRHSEIKIAVGELIHNCTLVSIGQAITAVEVTSKYPKVHGAPIHLGNPVENPLYVVTQQNLTCCVTFLDADRS
jgi:uncharacterized protein YcsI (UPF0317 family)